MTPAVVVVGAGGHAKVCIELLRAMGETVDYCVGSNDGPAACVGVPVLAGDEHLLQLFEQGYRRAFIAIGANAVRLKLAETAIAAGYELVNAISPTAVISPSARLGHGIAVMAGAVVNAESTIADLCIVNTGATVDHDGCVGKAAHIAPQCALAGNVTVGKLSFLGVGCRVIPGVAIGERVMIGAGSTVLADVPSNTTCVGTPAKQIKRV